MVAMGTKVPGRTHPTLVKEAKGCSVVVTGVAWDFIEPPIYNPSLLMSTKS
jgi:hypothetical protein